MTLLEKANQYQTMNLAKQDWSFRPSFHASSPMGWTNDPNGSAFFGGEAHMYFQYYPYSAVPNTMYWGHFSTSDFVKWKLLPLALAPDEPYEDFRGCWSGNTFIEGGKHYVFYTSVTEGYRQQQCLAVSEDGLHFQKDKNNPIIKSSDYPKCFSKMDFRDPMVWKKDDKYFLIASSRFEHGEMAILLFDSLDLRHFSYRSVFFTSDMTGGVFECPTLFSVDGQEILIGCPQFKAKEGNRFENNHGCIYITGNIDYCNLIFKSTGYDEIDSGFDFYAPQIISVPDGRKIMVAWMACPDRNYPTREYGWAGDFVIPRELSFKNGHLYQKPVKELENYRVNKVVFDNLSFRGKMSFVNIHGNKKDIELEADLSKADFLEIDVLASESQRTKIIINRQAKQVVFDRKESGLPIVADHGQEADSNVRILDTIDLSTVQMRILIDVSCVEVFIDDGLYAMTANVFPEAESAGFDLISQGETKIKKLTSFDIDTEGRE
jgi:beta-fructofuranosidase